jgi:hypothetical protein
VPRYPWTVAAGFAWKTEVSGCLERTAFWAELVQLTALRGNGIRDSHLILVIEILIKNGMSIRGIRIN